MMIADLMEAKLVSPKEYKLFCLFTSELGRECFQTMTEELFWEEPEEHKMKAGVLGFYDGRRSVLRGIKSTIDKIEALIKQQNLGEKTDDAR